MAGGRARRAWHGFLKLVMAFGFWGLAVWPATGWLGGQLLYRETAHMNGLHTTFQTLIGRDFVNIWHGGQEAAKAGAAGVYNREAYRKTLRPKTGFDGIYTFSYPPHMLLAALFFGAFPYLAALLLWTVGGLLLFWHAARPWLRDVGLPGWAVLVLPASFVNLWAGHFGFLVGALSLYGWRFAESRPMRSGLAFALMTVKPHMGVLVPLILMAKGQWRTLSYAALGALALVAVSAAIFGFWAWSTWLSSTLSYHAGLVEVVPRQPYNFMMPIVSRSIYALVPDPGIAAAAQALAALYGVGVLAWAHMRGVGTRDLGLLSIIAVFLILPYSFNYDMVAVSLTAMICAVRFRTRWWALDKPIYAAAFILPLALTPMARTFNFWPAPVILMLLLGCAAWRMAGKVTPMAGAVPAR